MRDVVYVVVVSTGRARLHTCVVRAVLVQIYLTLPGNLYMHYCIKD